MEKNIDFVKSKNQVSVICSKQTTSDDESLKILQCLEKDDKIKQISIQLIGSVESEIMIELFNIINKYPNSEKLSVLIKQNDSVFFSQFELLVQNISNLCFLEELNLSFGDNVLNFGEFQQINQFQSLQKTIHSKNQMPKLEKLQLAINKTVTKQSINIILDTFFTKALHLQSICLQIKDCSFSKQDQEAIYSELSELKLLKELSISISNNEDQISVQSLIYFTSIMKLNSIAVNLDKCDISSPSQQSLEKIENTTLKQINYTLSELKNTNFILSDALQSLQNMKSLQKLQIKINNCKDIEELQIYQAIGKFNQIKSFMLDVKKTNISEKAFSQIIQLMPSYSERILQDMKIFISDGKIQIEESDFQKNSTYLSFEKYINIDLINLIKHLSTLFKQIERIQTVQFNLFGIIKEGFKLENNIIEILDINGINCEENFYACQNILQSFNGKELASLNIQFQQMKKKYELQANQFEDAIVKFGQVQSLTLNLVNFPCFSGAIFAYLSQLISNQCYQIYLKFHLDNQLEQEENLLQNIITLTESMHQTQTLELILDISTQVLWIESKESNQTKKISLKIFLKKFSFYLLICLIKCLPNLKNLKHFQLIIQNLGKNLSVKLDNFNFKQNSAFSICKDIDMNFSFLYYLYDSFLPYIDKANKLSIDLVNWSILGDKVENHKNPFALIENKKNNYVKIDHVEISSFYNDEIYSFNCLLLNLMNNDSLKQLNLQFTNDFKILEAFLKSQISCKELESVLSKFKKCQHTNLTLQGIPCFSENLFFYFQNLVKQENYCVKATFNLDNKSEEATLIQHFQSLFKNKYFEISIKLFSSNNEIEVRNIDKNLVLNIICKNSISQALLKLLKGELLLSQAILFIKANQYELKIKLDENQRKNYLKNEYTQSKEEQFIKKSEIYDLLNLILKSIPKLESLSFSSYYFDSIPFDLSTPFQVEELHLILDKQKIDLRNFQNLKILKISDKNNPKDVKFLTDLFQQIFDLKSLISFQYVIVSYWYYNQQQIKLKLTKQDNLTQLKVLNIKKQNMFNCNIFKRILKRLVIIE